MLFSATARVQDSIITWSAVPNEHKIHGYEALWYKAETSLILSWSVQSQACESGLLQGGVDWIVVTNNYVPSRVVPGSSKSRWYPSVQPAGFRWKLLCLYNGLSGTSPLEELKAPLEEYVNKRYPGLVKVVRNQKREGLIRARIEGWKAATGQVTGFFDAHVEFTAGW